MPIDKEAITSYFNGVLCSMICEDRCEAAERTFFWYDDEYLSSIEDEAELDRVGDEAIAFIDSLV